MSFIYRQNATQTHIRHTLILIQPEALNFHVVPTFPFSLLSPFYNSPAAQSVIGVKQRNGEERERERGSQVQSKCIFIADDCEIQMKLVIGEFCADIGAIC